MVDSQDIQRCKDQWACAKAQRRTAHDRVITAFSHFIAGAGPGPTEDELARLKVCVAVEDEAAQNYVTLLERHLRA